MAKRPPRRRKTDRLTSPGSTVEEQQCDMAYAPFDRAAIASEFKWGIDRLPSLVSPETAAVWGKTMANLNAALDANHPGDVIACVNSAIRGLEIMDAEATAAGHAPATGQHLFEYELEYDIESGGDGEPFRFAVIKDLAEWRTLKDARPDLVIFSQREVAVALRSHLMAIPDAVRDAFPKAEVKNIKLKTPVDYANGGDTIPF